MVLQFPHFDPRVKPPLGTQLDWSDPINRGLVGCWLMNEGAGTIVNDLSGNGHVGAFSGNTAWTAGKYGAAISTADQSADRIVVPGNAVGLDGFSACTILFWARNNATTCTVAQYLMDKSGAGPCPYGIYFDAAEQFVVKFVNAAAGVGHAIRYASVNTDWHLFGAWWDGVNVNTIYDGVFGKSAALAGPMYASAHNVELCGSGGTSAYNGQVSHVMMYNRALTPSEIARLYREPFCVLRCRPITSIISSMGVGVSIKPAWYYDRLKKVN